MKTGLLPVPTLRLRYLSQTPGTSTPIAHVKNVVGVLVKPKQHGASFFLDKL
jgi:hypothetical protein